MSRSPKAAARKVCGDTANLYRRGETWWCRYHVAGSERRLSLHTTDVATARKARDRFIAGAADERAGRIPVTKRVWQDAVEGFLAFQAGQVRAGSISANTASRYETSIARLGDALEGESLTAITTGAVLDFVVARREENRSASTIRNDLTAWSRVMSYAVTKTWIEINPLRSFERGTYIGRDADVINPPTDAEVAALVAVVALHSPPLAHLITWLRETGMRLGEALAIQAGDVHPDGRTVTLRHGVKRNRASGLKTRTIDLGRAAALLPVLATSGRLFGLLPVDSAIISTRYGQWSRRRFERGTDARHFRLHDLRHAFAIATLIDDTTAVYRLKSHLGHSTVGTTEGYIRFLNGDGAQRRYSRRPDLFGSLPGEWHTGTESGTGSTKTVIPAARKIA